MLLPEVECPLAELNRTWLELQKRLVDYYQHLLDAEAYYQFRCSIRFILWMYVTLQVV